MNGQTGESAGTNSGKQAERGEKGERLLPLGVASTRMPSKWRRGMPFESHVKCGARKCVCVCVCAGGSGKGSSNIRQIYAYINHYSLMRNSSMQEIVLKHCEFTKENQFKVVACLYEHRNFGNPMC